MLHSSTQVVLANGNTRLKPHQYMLLNNLDKRSQYYDDVIGKKDRSEKSVPNMQQVIHTDMKRIKTNKVYDRKLNQDLNGPKGLNWQCKQELQRLRSDERDIQRDLIRINRNVSKMPSLHSLSRSPSLSRNQASRLSSIIEENSYLPPIEKPKSVLGRSSSTSPNQTLMHHLIPNQRRSSMIKINPHNEQSHSLPKHSLQQLIAKTSDDRSHLQQHAHIIKQQNRLIKKKLKQFLH